MKKLLLSFFLTFLIFCLNAQCEKEPFVLVELFTSQGCSSCPAADKKFNSYIDDPGHSLENTFMIAHHAKYWDHALPGPCGVSAWKDIFAVHGTTVTQSDYALALSGENRYATPQRVVQGQEMTLINLNSNESAIKNRMAYYASRTPEAGVCITPTAFNTENNSVTFNYSVVDTKNNGTERLVYVLVEDKLLDIEITAGENCNKVLDHERVRRSYKTLDLNSAVDADGTLTLFYPSDVVDANIRVGAFIQKKDSKKCIGGTKGFSYNSFFAATDENKIAEALTDVYPNPTNGIINISSASKISIIKIHDLTGKELLVINNINTDKIELDLNRKGLSEGVYTYQIIFENSEKATTSGKIVLH